MPINAFPGYEFVFSKEDGQFHNMYRGEDVGFGGYVYAKPGMYGRTVCFDVSGMHPASIRALNCFGEYTKNFADLVDARLAIKHKDFDTARKMLDGKLAPYLDDESQAKALSNALKIAVNSVFGQTFTAYDNPFRDHRNKNNQVALRGALFMVNLKHEIQDRGFTVIHCKTDSCKVVNPDEAITQFILDYGKKYGYNFEVEHAFERICLVNDAVYVAKLAEDDPDAPGQWTATGKQFQVPFVFKTLFSKEPVVFEDLCEMKEVKTSIYMDKNENLPDVSLYESLANIRARKKIRGLDDLNKRERRMLDEYATLTDEELTSKIAEGHNLQFVGKVGNFCPIKPGCGGAVLYREAKDDLGNIKYDAVTGTKDYRWLEAEYVKTLGKEDDVDRSYHKKLVDDAVEAISQYGDFERFVADEPYIVEEEPKIIISEDHPPDDDELPWYLDDEVNDLFKKR